MPIIDLPGLIPRRPVINVPREIVYPCVLVDGDDDGGLIAREGIQAYEIDGAGDVVTIRIHGSGQVLADVEGPLLAEGVGRDPGDDVSRQPFEAADLRVGRFAPILTRGSARLWGTVELVVQRGGGGGDATRRLVLTSEDYPVGQSA